MSGSATMAPASTVNREACSALAQAKVNTALSLARAAILLVHAAPHDWRRLPQSRLAKCGKHDLGEQGRCQAICPVLVQRLFRALSLMGRGDYRQRRITTDAGTRRRSQPLCSS